MSKPNCYNCKHRGTVPGSAHSSCKILSSTISDKQKTIEMELLLATGQIRMFDEKTNRDLVELNPHGVRNGWATWPMDFDPIWVDSCAFENIDTNPTKGL
jgi:hypothetical protein